ncbi:MAG TPA: hypothetical protein VFT82_03965 [Candidatus Paceibacterota bacterium]|nr:hypothetical protein [Candidatus Paceibacterota bacterium]
MEPKKLLLFAILAFGVVGLSWIIFGPHPEKYENETPVSEAVGNSYSNEQFGFEVTVPSGFTVDESYLNQDLGPGREIPGVAFRIPASMADGTNLSSDSYASVEELSDVDCIPSDFLSVQGDASGIPVTMGRNDYISASTTGAAAGNIYEETVFVTRKEDRCYAVRYFIHSANIGNYPEGSVREFDRAGLVSSFDSIASSLTLY